MKRTFIFLMLVLFCDSQVRAAYIPFDTNVKGNIGVGTAGALSKFVVVSGNLGIGTWTAVGGNLIVNGGGNVGIGSAWPGQALDEQGTARVTNFTMTGQSPMAGYVLTASDSNGDAVWTSASGVTGWNVSGNNVYENGNGNVGIGTATTGQGALVVTNGNVGVGTWTTAGGSLIVKGGGMVGIGFASPGQTMDINGTLRSTGFAMSTNAAGSSVLTSDVNGASSWIPNPTGGGWTASGSNEYLSTMTNNVGMGTSTPQAGLVVTNGNVGIGTWAPAGKFQVNGSTTPSFIITSSGNVGIGTSTPQAGFVVVNGNMGIGTITSNYSLYVNGTAGSAKNVLIGNGLAILTNKNVGIGQNVPTGFEIESNNVGIGTNLDAGALVNVGGNCKTQQGKGVCWGSNSTTGVTCLGYCTTVGWPNCTTCTCC